jgi:hypothetical protein
VGDALQNEGAVLANGALASCNRILDSEGAGAVTLPPLPPASAEAFYLDEAAGDWVPFKPGNYEARTIFSETTMAFESFSVQRGLVLLSGPSGAGAGHGWNRGGFDGVGFNVEGPLRLMFPDEKATSGTVRSATALTDNWQQNIERFQHHLAASRFDLVPRIDEVRTVIDAAVLNAQRGLPPPAEVSRLVTRSGEPAPVGGTLARRLMSGTETALSEPRTIEAHPAVEQFPRALMSPRSVGARTAEVSEAAANAAPLILGWLKGPLDEHLLANDVEAKFADGKNQVAEYQRQNPDKGVLLAVEIRQHPGTRNWGVERPRPQAVSVIPTYGYTSANEARAAYEAQPSISDANMEQLPPAYQWLPPLRATPQQAPSN